MKFASSMNSDTLKINAVRKLFLGLRGSAKELGVKSFVGKTSSSYVA